MNLSAFKPFLTISFAFGLLVFSSTLSAPVMADDILPPPDGQDSDASNRDSVDRPVAGEQAPNLQQELSAPKKGEEVDVRSYMRKDGANISEYSSHGRVNMIKVQPAGGLPAYYLYDNNGDGQFDRRLPGGYKRISPPSWVLKRF